MSKAYGRMSRGTAQKPTTPPREVLIKIHDRHTLEQLSMQLQIMIGRLEQHRVHGVQQVRLRMEMLDEKGQPMALWSENGEPLAVLQIPEPAPEPPYRPG